MGPTRRPEGLRPGPLVGQPASRTLPKRLNPQSQSFSQSYGSSLPTSLTYIILSTRGYSPRRPAADMSTIWCDTAVTLSLIFKVPPNTHGHCKIRSALCAVPKPSLSVKEFQGLGGLGRKDNSSQSAGGRLRLISRCRVGLRANRFHYQGEESIPHSLSAKVCIDVRQHHTLSYKASPKP